MRTIAVVTVGRSDYGIYRPVLARLRASAEVHLQVIATGMHFPARFGETIKEIEADGQPIGARVDHLLASDSAESVAMSMGLGTHGCAQAYARVRPDLLVVLGDRAEMHAAAVAAVPFGIPIAHIHGGEITEGAIDDAFRHAITKLSHLHFVSTEAYAARVRQMGEEAWRVVVSGAPSLDNLRLVPVQDRAALASRLDLALDEDPLVVTFHPETLEAGQEDEQIQALLQALEGIARPLVFTMPNADVGGQHIAAQLQTFVSRTPSARLVANLGTAGYFGLMSIAAAMVGNSSSGLIEAPSFALPVVNIGGRQQGRVRAANVIDVEADAAAIRAGVAQALAPAFRASLRGLVNPYGDGTASARIVDRLVSQPLDRRLIMKRFIDIRSEP